MRDSSHLSRETLKNLITILNVIDSKTSVATIKLMNQDLMKLDRLDGTNFTRQQEKLKFLLTALKIYYVLDPEFKLILEPTDKETDELKPEHKKQRQDELICYGHILDALSDHLYDLYIDTQLAKKIWNTLDFKYKVQKEGAISKYFDFQMVDEKSILAQVHEL